MGARFQHRLGLLVAHAGHQPQWHAARAKLVDVALEGDDGQVVTRVGEHQLPGVRLEHAVETGHEHVLGDVGAEVLVDPLEHGARGDQPLRRSPQHAARRGHHESRGHALVGHVPDHKAEPAVGKVDEIVEIAAHLAGRPVLGCDAPSRRLRKRARQEVLLDQACNRQLLIKPLAASDLGLLLPHQLAHPHRRGGLGGQALEQPPVVAGVLLIGEAGPQVEQPDQLTLGDQRHHQLHAGGAEVVKRRRLELESIDVDGAHRALEERDDGIVGSDVHRRHG